MFTLISTPVCIVFINFTTLITWLETLIIKITENGTWFYRTIVTWRIRIKHECTFFQHQFLSQFQCIFADMVGSTRTSFSADSFLLFFRQLVLRKKGSFNASQSCTELKAALAATDFMKYRVIMHQHCRQRYLAHALGSILQRAMQNGGWFYRENQRQDLSRFWYCNTSSQETLMSGIAKFSLQSPLQHYCQTPTEKLQFQFVFRF